MNTEENFLYQPRKFNTIELWKDVTREQWSDPKWQKKNSIRTVEQLKKVIILNNHQEKEIIRTINMLKKEGKEPFRISPYYASLMQEDPFHPVFFQKNQKSVLIRYFGKVCPPLQTCCFLMPVWKARWMKVRGALGQPISVIRTGLHFLLLKIRVVPHIVCTAKGQNRWTAQLMLIVLK